MAQDRAPRPAAGNDALPPGGGGGAPSQSNEKGGTYFLGRYRVVDEIGVGGMASVHLARMDGPGGFQKWVAIKRIHPHLVEDDSFVHMFLDEARVAARISHPNVATVFELGKHEDTYWIAMEYLHGEPLREVMRRTEELGQPMPPEIACRVIADAAEGLHAAHELLGKNGEKLGLVHRDVTPHNLFVTYDGNTKVVDFGIAKFSSRMASTRAGTLKGKLAYMSPEQVAGEPIDRRTDIFALGVVLWELTTGQRLFRMESDLDTLAKVQECNVPRPSTIVRGYPIDLEKIVMKALAKNKNERFRTARELSRALQSLLMRRGLFVASDEVAAYTRSIFADRIRKREAHLRWAAEVTQTLSLDSHKAAAAGHINAWGDDRSMVSQSSEVEAAAPAPARGHGVPRPAAGAPAPAPSGMRSAGPNADTFRPPAARAAAAAAIPPAPPAPVFPSESSPRLADDGTDTLDDLDDYDDTIVQAPRMDIAEAIRSALPGPLPAAGRPAPSGGPSNPNATGKQSAAGRSGMSVPPPPTLSPGVPRGPSPLGATQPAGLRPVAELGDMGIPVSPADPTVGVAPDQRTHVLLGRRQRTPTWLLAAAAGFLGLTVVGLIFAVVSRTSRPSTAQGPSPFAAARSAFSTALAAPPGVPTRGVGGGALPGATEAKAGAGPAVASAATPPSAGPSGTGPSGAGASAAGASAGQTAASSAAQTGAQTPSPAPAPAGAAGEARVAPTPHAVAPTPVPVRTAPAPAPAPAKAATPPKKAEIAEGLLTVVCMPACDQVLDNNNSLGKSPIFKTRVPVGEHRLKLVRGNVTKVVSVIVTANETAAVRQSMTP